MDGGYLSYKVSCECLPKEKCESGSVIHFIRDSASTIEDQQQGAALSYKGKWTYS